MESKYRILVVDDEKPAHLVIQSHVSKCEDLEIINHAYNGKEALSLLIENEYDMVFLDIEMPLLNGLELMETLNNRPATIITSAYNNFGFEAYQNDAIDYLLKPISFPKFIKAVEKAKLFCKSKDADAVIETSMVVKHDGEAKVVDFSDILYIQSIGNYLKIILKNKTTPLVIYDTLKSLNTVLPANQFLQIHKSFIVNIKCIKLKGKDEIKLENDIALPVGRRYSLLLTKL